jgi:hypothetical protein
MEATELHHLSLVLLSRMLVVVVVAVLLLVIQRVLEARVVEAMEMMQLIHPLKMELLILVVVVAVTDEILELLAVTAALAS